MPNNSTLADLIQAARVIADYTASLFVTDTELSIVATEAISAYYDLVLSSRETYFRETYPFTLTGGYGNNTTTLPADLYKIQGLDWNPGNSSVQTVPVLPSYRERNSVAYRCYDWTPDTLTIYPPTSSNGNYELTYTPRAPILAEQVTDTTTYPTIEITADASDAVDGTLNSWYFPNGTFDSTYVGKFLGITGATNPDNNGLFLITAVTDATDLTTATSGGSEVLGLGVTANVYTGPLDAVSTGASTSWTFNSADFDDIPVGSTITVAGSATSDGTYTVVSGGSTLVITSTGPATPEAFLPGVTVSHQPPGTLYRLPDTMQSGSNWIELFIADTILDKAEQDSGPVKMRLAAQTKRIQDALRWKQDEPRQVPLVRRNHGRWGW